MSDWFDAETHADRALEMYERGRWAEAESELRKAISLNPDQAEWHFNLGLTLEAAGRDLEALVSYERVIELLPDEPDPLVAAGMACNRVQRFERGIELFDRAIAISPGLEAAYAHKIDALARLGDHDEAEATFYLAQHALEEPGPHCFAAVAESLIDRRQYERAGWCLKEALRLEPQMPRLRARLAAVLAATGKPQRALQMYLRDLRDDPGNIDTLLDFGELLIDLGRHPEAAEKFRRVLELEPANVDAHERLGHIAMASGRWEQAHLEFELVLKLDPQFPLIRLALGRALLERGHLEAARQCLRDEMDDWLQEGADDRPRPISRNRYSIRAALPDSSPTGAEDGGIGPLRNDEVCVRFGDLLLDAELPTEAAKLYQLAIAVRAESAPILRKLAIARFRSDDLDGGVAASRRVLRFDPKCVASIHNLALAALGAGQLRVASGWIARGLRVDRHDDGLRRLRMQHWLAWMRSWLTGRRGQ
ncbi:MAG: tetratricopeptide repeat protein [Planctomycetes bacterium]|nr:tetratricopeptide repeat protein [Planctomycetota bacterium]